MESPPNKSSCDWVSPNTLQPWARNPKDHSAENTNDLARSIVRFGFTDPIEVWRSKQQIVSGHGRLMAVNLLLAEDPGRVLAIDAPEPGLVLVRWLEFASQDEADAYALAANRHNERNPMNADKVAEIFADFEERGVSLEGIGYSDEEREAMLGGEEEGAGGSGEGDPDADPPEPPAVPVSRLGEVYELGPHRLVCGDCRDQGPWVSLSAGVNPPESITFTSPPYNAGKAAQLRGKAASGTDSFYIEEDDTDWLQLMNDWTAQALRASEVVICNVQLLAGNKRALFEYLGQWRMHVHDVGVWDKGHAQPAFIYSVMNSVFEFVLFLGRYEASRKLPLTDFHGTVDNIFRESAQKNNEYSDVHKATMPLQFAISFLKLFVAAKYVFEPFGGTGTTLIAAAHTGRIARLIELDPRYCDVIRRRWTTYAKSAGIDPGPGALEAG